MRRIIAGDDVARLARSAERLVALAKAIDQRTRDLADHPAAAADAPTVPEAPGAPANLVDAARDLIRAHRGQPDFGAPALFRNHLWLLVLDLFIADSCGNDTSVKAACLALGGSQTTSLRSILDLERHGVIESRADAADGRRRLVSLSPAARGAVIDYLGRQTAACGRSMRLSMRLTTQQHDEADEAVNTPGNSTETVTGSIDATMDRTKIGCETVLS